MDTKFSATRASILGFGGVVVLVGGLLGWSMLASVSGAVIATGWVAGETRNQVVQRLEGGTVSEVLVREGDRVVRGDLLIRFSDGLLRSEEAILVSQYAELVARRNRLEAEFQGAQSIAWDRELAAMAAADPTVANVLKGQERHFRARAAARAGEAAQLRERIGQTRDEITGLTAQAKSLKHQSELIGRELTVQRGLYEKGMSHLAKLLSLERAAKNLEGRSGTTAARIARTKGRISELEIQILQVDSRRIEEAEEQARDVSARENLLKQRLASVSDGLGRMEVRAPVSGRVFGMRVSAPQEVVRPGEPILEIVSEDAGFVVMARIKPIDVDQVYPGQAAVLRFSAFPARETPEFAGKVVRVSADVVRDDRSGLSWYEVELALDRPAATTKPGDGAEEAKNKRRLFGDLLVTPGMPVEAHIRTAERSVISYLAKPVSDFFYRSLREE